jgi:nucleotide-binding universal stress UspA family protein
MIILCGTDFTPSAAAAADAASALAARLQASLRLIHVTDAPDADDGGKEPSSRAARLRAHHEAERGDLEQRLRAEAKRIAAHGVAAEPVVLTGQADEALVAEAGRAGAGLIVTGALGQRARPRWRLGSTTDRIAQHAACPVLVARDAGPFTGWARNGAPLRIVVGVDASPASEVAIRWLPVLRAGGPLKLVGAHVYWPPEVRERLHLHGPVPIGKNHPEVDAAITRELGERFSARTCGQPVELRIVGGLGRIGDHLVQIAEEEKADLIVVGSQQRGSLERIWHGSISHRVVEAAPMNVLCVPSQ